MDVGKTYKVEIEDYDINGYGVSHIDSKVVFVKGALEGEIVLAKIENIHKKYAFAEACEIIKESPDRQKPECPYYEACGGCDMMHMTYEVECRIKEGRLKQTFRRFKNVEFHPIIQNKNLLGYRNKVMMPFQVDSDLDVCYGFYEKKSHKIVPIDQCIISDDVTNDIIYYINRFLNIFHIKIYDEDTHKGLFREVMIRHTATNEYMVVIVSTHDYDFSVLVKYLVEEFNCIKSIYLNINPEKTNVVLGDKYKLLYGKPVILEDILTHKFQVSPQSFMQVNHDQCERLYMEALRLADLRNDMTVIDAYCGMGSITLNIARRVKKVYGIEIVESAIENAKENMKLNNITNAEFICGACEEEIVKLVNKEKIDAIFFDPPRKGCDTKFLDTVIQMQIPQIVYISCNVATCARDCAYLEEKGYKVMEATPVDLFSRTLHVEAVCLLHRKND